MSRIGNNPITVADGVNVEFKGGVVTVKGPKGTLSKPYSEVIKPKLEDGKITFERVDEDKKTKALHGLMRSLVANMVTGVSDGFTKTLEIVGVGYRAEEAGKQGIKLNLGYSNPIDFELPEGVSSVIEERGTRIILSGIDKETIGQTAAKIRKLREPDAYKGKGVRYQGEQPRLKPGKSGAKTGA